MVMGCRFLGVMRGGGTGGALLSSGIPQKIWRGRKKTRAPDSLGLTCRFFEGGGRTTYLPVFLNQNLNDNILEFYVQHGCHGLHLGPHQRGSKDDSHVGGSHAVVFTVTADTVDRHRAWDTGDSKDVPVKHRPGRRRLRDQVLDQHLKHPPILLW